MKHWRGLPGIVAVALLLRMAVAGGAWLAERDLRTWSVPDTPSYVAPARSLVERGAFTTAGRPEIKRTPGYPLLLAPGIGLGPWPLTTLALQLALAGATTCAVAAIARTWTGSTRSGWLAAALYACEPLSITYTSLLMPETLFTCLTTSALLAAMSIDRIGWRGALACGALLGAAALVRPIGMYLWAVFALMLAVQRPRVRPVAILLLCAAALAPQAAWRVRNAIQADYYGLSTIGDINAYFYSAAATLAAQEGRSYYEVQRELGYQDDGVYLARHPEQRAWSDAQRARFYRQEAQRIATHAPATYARLHVSGMLRMLLDPGAVDLLRLLGAYPTSGGLLGRAVDRGLAATALELCRERPLVAAASAVLGIWLAVYYALAVMGLWRQRRRAPFPWLLVATLAYFALVSGGPQALARFRAPMMPLVCALAGGALLAPQKPTSHATDPRSADR